VLAEVVVAAEKPGERPAVSIESIWPGGAELDRGNPDWER